MPEWARRERHADLDWIAENLDLYWTAAAFAFKATGRGAIVVDTTIQPAPVGGHPLGYFSQDQIGEACDEDTKRIVNEYDPAQELVLVLLKPDDHTSTYRLRGL